MKKGLISMLVLLFVGLQSVFAQSREISGVVTSAEDGLTIPGVSVMVKGTTTGVSTDLDGKYSLKVPADAKVLVFSFVGMETQEIAIAGKTTINVVLKSAAKTIGEVMVVAYGTAKKSSFTGSASKVEGEKLEKKNTADISKAIASESPGVQVINSSGQPGTNATIRIRGFGSVNASRNPLYIVNGMPFDGDLSSIDPADIESTTILKDASATALYGARGANGVILVTTKRGKKGKSKIDVSIKTGINTQLLPMYDVIDSPEQFTELTWEGMFNRHNIEGVDPALLNGRTIGEYTSDILFSADGISPGYNMWNQTKRDLIDPVTGKFRQGVTRRYTPESWRDNIFRNGLLVEGSLKISGGNEKTTHYTSFSYRGDEGYYMESSFERLNARTNLTHKVKDWFKTGLDMSYTYMVYNSPGQSGAQNNGFNYVNNMPPLFPVFQRDVNGNKIEDTRIGGYLYDYGFSANLTRPFGSGINPAGAVKLDKQENISHQIVVNPYMEFKINDDFKFTTKFSAQFLLANKTSVTNFFYGDAKGIGRIGKTDSKYLTYTWNQILSWKHNYDLHHLSAFVGHESYFSQTSALYGRKSKVASPYINELDNAIIMDAIGSYTNEVALESFLAQVKYDFDEKYFFSLNVRRDGTSRFPNDKWGTFGAVGAAWVVSKEDFMSSTSNWLKELKLKASYGVIGNQDLGTAYPTYDNYTVSNLNDELSAGFNYKGNPNLTWERSATINTGVEFNINDVLEGSVEYFVKNTDNLLFYKQVARSLGYATLPVNDGELQNKGIEFDLTAHVVNTNDLKVNFRLNGASYSNEIKHMPREGADNKEKFLEQHGNFGYQNGRSLYDYYMREYAGVNKDTGVAEWYIYYDEVNGEKIPIANMEQYIEKNGKITKLIEEKTSSYDDATQKFLNKSLIPKLSGGFGLDVSYKGLSLSAQFAYSIGGYAYDSAYATLMHNGQPGAHNWHKDIVNRWTKPGDVTDVPRLSADFDKNGNKSSSRFLTDASYLGLNTASITYDFPKRMLKSLNINKLSVFVSGDNLFLLSKRDGFSPVTAESGSTSTYRYTPVSTFTLGAKVSF